MDPIDAQKSQVHRAFTAATVLALTLLSLFIGLHHLGTRSIWVDEGASLSIASQRGFAFLHGLGRDGGNQAAYYVLLKITTTIFGSGGRVIRMPSTLAAVATVPLAYGLGREARSARCGVYAAALAACCAPLTYWAQNARGETLAAAFATASGWALLCVARRASRASLVAWVICSSLMCWSLMVAVLIFGSQLLVLGVWWGRLAKPRATAVAAIVTLLSLAPLGLLAVHRGGSQLFWLDRPNHRSILAVLRLLAGSTTSSVGGWHAVTINVACAVALVVTVVICLIGVVRRRMTPPDPSLFALSWVVVAPVVALVLSFKVQPFFLDRYFVPCIPGVALLLALVLDRLRPAVIGLVLLCVLTLLRASELGASYRLSRDDWRDATAAILARTEPGDCVAFYVNDGWTDFNYYLGRSATPTRLAPRPVLPASLFGGVSTPLLVESYDALTPVELEGCVRTWLVLSHSSGSNGSPFSTVVTSGLARTNTAIRSTYEGRVPLRFLHIAVELYFRRRP